MHKRLRPATPLFAGACKRLRARGRVCGASSAPPSNAVTHTHARTHARTRARAHARARARTHTHTHKHTHACARARTSTRTRRCAAHTPAPGTLPPPAGFVPPSPHPRCDPETPTQHHGQQHALDQRLSTLYRPCPKPKPLIPETPKPRTPKTHQHDGHQHALHQRLARRADDAARRERARHPAAAPQPAAEVLDLRGGGGGAAVGGGRGFWVWVWVLGSGDVNGVGDEDL
jgi:hypothetical protein